MSETVSIIDSETDEQFQNSVRTVNNILITYPEFKNTFYFGKLYGLYKQALFGDNKTPCPYFFYFKSREKWNLWNKHIGKNKKNAKKKYTEVLYDFKLESYGSFNYK